MKETLTRYDFKGTTCKLDFDRADGVVKLDADDEFRLTQLLNVLREKLSRRKVPLKNIDEGPVEVGSLGRARVVVGLKSGIDQDTAKKISKDIRDGGFKNRESEDGDQRQHRLPCQHADPQLHVDPGDSEQLTPSPAAHPCLAAESPTEGEEARRLT
ncbi:MAG: DUF520 family protein [Gemmatimonadetes bacterium]|nr:DUF520 family protein [Gemmatimonadota bacterium]